MAKGIEMNGQLRGKRGGVVYYRAQGQQISRSRNFAPSNPRSRAQMIQRLMLANASKAAVGLKQIIDHSFEGVKYGSDSVRHFQSMAQQTLKSASPSIWANGLVTPCVPMDALGFPVAKFLVSSGSLPSAQYRAIFNDTEGNFLTLEALAKTNLTSLATMTVQDFFDAFGVSFGSQITIVACSPSHSIGGASMNLPFADNEIEAPIRLNFKSNAASELMFDQNGRIKADVLVVDKSNAFDIPTWTVDEGKLIMEPPYNMSAVAVIVSAYENGAWRRSTEHLEVAALNGQENLDFVREGWGWNEWQPIVDSLYASRGVQEVYFLNKETNETPSNV